MNRYKSTALRHVLEHFDDDYKTVIFVEQFVSVDLSLSPGTGRESGEREISSGRQVNAGHPTSSNLRCDQPCKGEFFSHLLLRLDSMKVRLLIES